MKVTSKKRLRIRIAAIAAILGMALGLAVPAEAGYSTSREWNFSLAGYEYQTSSSIRTFSSGQITADTPSGS